MSSDGDSYEATDSATSAALAENGGTLSLTGGSLTKSGDDEDGDACHFYGVNSVLLAVGESGPATLDGTPLSATSTGSNGIFATGSQIAGMEGLNAILINDSELTSTSTGATASDPVANGIIIYQSTSDDAESTTGEQASFQAADPMLSSSIQSGSMFYLTNTSASIVLQDTTLGFDSDAARLLTAAGNDSNNWGTAGSNGATEASTSTASSDASTTDDDGSATTSQNPIVAFFMGIASWFQSLFS